MKVIIDRFEGNFAVTELPNGKTVNCPLELIPENAKEGSIINITVDEKETNRKLKEAEERMNRLFEN